MARGCFRGFENDNVPGTPLLWQVEQDAILRCVREFVRRDLEDTSGFIPRYFEQHFTLDLTAEVGLTFHGMLDRIDLAPDGRARVIDYTTGRERSGLKDGSLALWQRAETAAVPAGRRGEDRDCTWRARRSII